MYIHMAEMRINLDKKNSFSIYLPAFLKDNYVVVTMTIENVGKESSTMTSNDVKIVNSQGRTFESDSKAWAALKDNILIKQIQPGLPVTGETVFDVPKGITCNLQVTDGGWGIDPKLISLGTIQ
jgi:hypothetical protein